MMSRSISPSEQLEESLRQSIQSALSTRRPLLHHLNADSSWLVQIPRPLDELGGKGEGRARKYYNILIDPWLSGAQSYVAAWFSTQWHADESRVGSIGAVEELIGGIERTASEEDEDVDMDVDGEDEGRSCIDAVVICHEFTDHCHKDTLLEVDKRVPVFGTKVCTFRILNIVRSLTILTSCLESSRPDTLLEPLLNSHHHPSFHILRSRLENI